MELLHVVNYFVAFMCFNLSVSLFDPLRRRKNTEESSPFHSDRNPGSLKSEGISTATPRKDKTAAVSFSGPQVFAVRESSTPVSQKEQNIPTGIHCVSSIPGTRGTWAQVPRIKYTRTHRDNTHVNKHRKDASQLQAVHTKDGHAHSQVVFFFKARVFSGMRLVKKGSQRRRHGRTLLDGRGHCSRGGGRGRGLVRPLWVPKVMR